MSLYKNGAKKITGLFGNVNGRTKKIMSLWTNKNGFPVKVFSLENRIKYFVALGSSSNAFRSLDGITWTSITLPNTNIYQALTYGKGKFLACSTSGNVIASTDGETWELITKIDCNAKDMVCGHNGFVVCEDGTNFYHSLDGITWEVVNLEDSYPTLNFTGLCYGNGRYICVGNPGKAFYSDDGITWLPTTGLPCGTSSEHLINDCLFAKGCFYCVNTKNEFYKSEDGINWTLLSTIPGDSYRICYGQDRFISVGDFGQCYYSLDGETWVTMPKPGNSQNNLTYVTYGNDKFVVTDNKNYAYYSLDGETWVTASGRSKSSTKYSYVVCYG